VNEPLISVVVPAHNAESLIPRCLAALAASDLPRGQWELIVVDDSSNDETGRVASAVADKVIELRGRPRGPAFARNHGFEAARARIVAFIDADVCVHSDVLRRFTEILTSDDAPAAVFGSYDDTPAASAFVSQYRNLLHHYVHQHNAGYVRSFWAGCGAVRREPFVEAGMFDEARYPAPQIEDIELGYRMHDRGYRVLLEPSILATHWKRWSLTGMMRSDFAGRGVPWMQLLLQRGELLGSDDLSVGRDERLSTIVLAALVLFLIALPATRNPLWLVATAACLGALLVLDRKLIAWYFRKRGVRFAVGAVIMQLLYRATNVASAIYGAATHLLGSSTPPAKVLTK
jgi:glycosyltransferase involved in cell wall biosynthesis